MSDSLLDEACSVESLVGRVADEFLQRQQRGERPDVQEYLDRYPEAAELLRKVLASLQVLELSAAEAGAGAAAGDEAPQALGDFRIVREVGRGGMGVVYEAVQLSLGRRVALKVLPFASTLDAKQLQRFKNEAQAAAHLHHQHIVPVYATGCERGVHYYAMQFIEGQTLAAVIADLRRLAGAKEEPAVAPRPAPAPAADVEVCSAGEATGPYADDSSAARRGATSTAPDTPGQAVVASSTPQASRSPAYFRTVATLGVQAGLALEHAHQLGVVHRDIKPANLLVDRRGDLWVTDFGLAHCQSQAGLTLTGDLVGTLRYMSPEQALAKRVLIDHRTDVYSLGVTLYELLTLEPAFAGRDRQELLRQIAFEEPVPPRRLNKAVPPELETIVAKATEKNPEERYATAQELADDLGRWLKDEPIRARRATLAGRARKWFRRHPAVGWSAAVILAVTAVVSAASTLRVTQEIGRKEAALEQATEQKTIALHKEAEAERAARDAQAVTDFLIDVLGASAPERALGRNLTVAEVLANAEATIDRAFPDQPLTEATLRHTIGSTYSLLGQYDKAERHLRQAGDVRTRLLGAEHRDTLRSRNNLAVVLLEWGKLPEARRILDETLERRTRRFGPDDADTLQSVSGLANVLVEQGHYREARRLREQVVERLTALKGPEHPDTLTAKGALADVFADLGHLREAAEIQEQILAQSRRRRGPRHPDTLLAMYNTGKLLISRGRLADARQRLAATLALDRQVHGPEHRDTLGTMTALADALMRLGRFKETRDLLDQAIPVQRRLLGDTHPVTMEAQNILASVLHHQARWSEERKLRETMVKLREDNFGPEHPGTLRMQSNLAELLWEQGLQQEAVKRLRAVVDVRRRVLGPDHPATLLATNRLAAKLWRQGQLAEAARMLDETVRRFKEQLGPDQQDTLAALMNRGNVYVAQRRFAEARKLFEEVVQRRQATLGPEHPDTLDAMSDLASALMDLGRPDEALARHQRVLALRQKVQGPEHPATLVAMHNVAVVLAHLAAGNRDRWDDVRQRAERVLDLRRRVLGREHPETLATLELLAQALFYLGKADESRRRYEEAVEGLTRVVGPEHPDTLAAMANLSVLLIVQHQFEEARRLRAIVFEVRQRTLAPEHPLTTQAAVQLAESLNAVARYVLRGSGKLAETEQTLRQALALLEPRLTRFPRHAVLAQYTAQVSHNLARCLLVRPGGKSRAVPEALRLAKRASELDGREGTYWNTLGVAYYRASQWPAALAALEKGVSLAQPPDSYDWFWLAMAHWRLGHKDEARRWYDRAVAWMEQNAPRNEVLHDFQVEAAELLGIKGMPKRPATRT
jgi:serine/threonine protein kinase